MGKWRAGKLDEQKTLRNSKVVTIYHPVLNLEKLSFRKILSRMIFHLHNLEAEMKMWQSLSPIILSYLKPRT